MKKLLFGFIVVSYLVSCSGDDQLFSGQPEEKYSLETYPQKWQLVQMSGSIPNSETTGSDMEWQEFYLLHPDNTFVKSRERDGVVTEAAGTCAFIEISGELYLELIYNTDNELIGNCTVRPEEHLWLISEGRLTSGWQACDGPGLIYQRVK